MAASGAEVEEIHLNRQKIEHCRACGTGRGAIECLTDMEKALTHMSMRAFDRIPVVRFNRDYMLPALEGAGKQYVHCLANGFDMYY